MKINSKFKLECNLYKIKSIKRSNLHSLIVLIKGSLITNHWTNYVVYSSGLLFIPSCDSSLFARSNFRCSFVRTFSVSLINSFNNSVLCNKPTWKIDKIRYFYFNINNFTFENLLNEINNNFKLNITYSLLVKFRFDSNKTFYMAGKQFPVIIGKQYDLDLYRELHEHILHLLKITIEKYQIKAEVSGIQIMYIETKFLIIIPETSKFTSLVKYVNYFSLIVYMQEKVNFILIDFKDFILCEAINIKPKYNNNLINCYKTSLIVRPNYTIVVYSSHNIYLYWNQSLKSNKKKIYDLIKEKLNNIKHLINRFKSNFDFKKFIIFVMKKIWNILLNYLKRKIKKLVVKEMVLYFSAFTEGELYNTFISFVLSLFNLNLSFDYMMYIIPLISVGKQLFNYFKHYLFMNNRFNFGFKTKLSATLPLADIIPHFSETTEENWEIKNRASAIEKLERMIDFTTDKDITFTQVIDPELTYLMMRIIDVSNSDQYSLGQFIGYQASSNNKDSNNLSALLNDIKDLTVNAASWVDFRIVRLQEQQNQIFSTILKDDPEGQKAYKDNISSLILTRLRIVEEYRQTLISHNLQPDAFRT